MHFSGDVTLIANQCTEPDEFFNSLVTVLPGDSIVLTCSLFETNVRWNSPQFVMPVQLDFDDRSAVESGIVFQIGTISQSPLCSNATATITNIQPSMDELNLTCFNPIPPEFTSAVVFNVIGK